MYINEDIPLKIIQNSSLPPTLKVLPIEINLGRFKFLLIGLYKPPSVSEKEFLLHLKKAHNLFSTKYENITLIDDFNMEPGNQNLKDFCDLNQVEHLILKPNCLWRKNTFNNWSNHRNITHSVCYISMI